LLKGIVEPRGKKIKGGSSQVTTLPSLPLGIDKKTSHWEQKAGEIYKQAPDDPGGRPEKNSGSESPSLTAKQKIIQDTDKDKKTFHKWAKEAAIPKETVLQYEALCNEEGRELTSAGLLYHTQPEKKVDSPPLP
jgi:hypothetical protein